MCLIKRIIVSLLLLPLLGLQLLCCAQQKSGGAGRTEQRQQGRFAADKCVFILATAGSGSTALMDALNQIPNYLIRGENWAAQLNLYHAYQRLSTISRAPGQEHFDWDDYRHASFQTVKDLYEAKATKQKLPFFNEFHPERVVIASRVYYNALYGHYGDGIVTGFKEVRYVCGLSVSSTHCAEGFAGFTTFLRKLCINVKVLLLTRGSHSSHANPHLFEGVPEGHEKSKVEHNLQRTHEVYSEYVDRYPEAAYRVYTEHMFDPQKNSTLARNILGFLQEEPSMPISFTRMPSWTQ